MTFNAAAAVTAYPQLYALIGGYFHQDWADEFEGLPRAALDGFTAPGGPEVNAAAAEIDALLRSHDDLQLAKILERFDNNYNYAFDGYTARTWLEAVREHLRAPRNDARAHRGTSGG
jgi:hypothetical protein